MKDLLLAAIAWFPRPVRHYTFEPNTVNGNVLTDLSGTQNGTIVGSPTFGTGQRGNCIKFNGAKTYRVEQKEIKDILQVDLKAGFRKGFLVSDYDQLESTLQVLVLPDSEFSFGFGAGGIYIVKDGRIFPYGEIFLRKNLFRIRGRKKS